LEDRRQAGLRTTKPAAWFEDRFAQGPAFGLEAVAKNVQLPKAAVLKETKFPLLKAH